MATPFNQNKVREMLQRLKYSGNQSVWKPKPGQYVIRIIPYKYNTETPFIELYFHYNFNNKTILSPITYGRPDPIVEFAKKLQADAGGDKEMWKQGRKLEPTPRVYVPIIVRGSESEGVKYWGLSKKALESIGTAMLDPDYGDISNPTAGHDISVEIIDGKTLNPPKKYNDVALLIKPKQTPAIDFNNAELVAKIKDQKNITEVFPEPSYDDLKAQMDTWLNAGGPSSDTASDDNAGDVPAPSHIQETHPQPTTADTAKSATPSVPVTPISSTATSDVKAKFDSLFDS